MKNEMTNLGEKPGHDHIRVEARHPSVDRGRPRGQEGCSSHPHGQ